MNPRISDNLAFDKADSEGCSVCRDLLTHLDKFSDMLNSTRRYKESDWLTVEEIATELKISKSIVYRLIRLGELEAVNIVHADGKVPKKGHYRIKRQNLNRYLESKTVKPFSSKFSTSRSRYFPKVKNHLGL